MPSWDTDPLEGPSAMSDPSEAMLHVIDLQLIRKALEEARDAPDEAARARAFVASLSARLLMDGELALGNALGTLIGLRPLDAAALERLMAG